MAAVDAAALTCGTGVAAIPAGGVRVFAAGAGAGAWSGGDWVALGSGWGSVWPEAWPPPPLCPGSCVLALGDCGCAVADVVAGVSVCASPFPEAAGPEVLALCFAVGALAWPDAVVAGSLADVGDDPVVASTGAFDVVAAGASEGAVAVGVGVAMLLDRWMMMNAKAPRTPS